ncbi:MAG: hypothetical protein ACK4NR_06735 [Micavibrio sp.]
MSAFVFSRTKRIIPVYIVVMALMSMTLAACGTKPSSLSPPADGEDTVFPRTYPDPATDPQ